MTTSRVGHQYYLSWIQKLRNGDHQESLIPLQIQIPAQSHALIHHNLRARYSHFYCLSASLYYHCITNRFRWARTATGPFRRCIIPRAALTDGP